MHSLVVSRIVRVAEIALLAMLGLRALPPNSAVVTPPSAAVEAGRATLAAIAPTATSAQQRSATTPAVRSPQHRQHQRAPDLGERYENAIDKRTLYEELRDSGSADAFFFAAEILRDCFEVAEQGFAAVVDRFLSNLPTDSPRKTEQVAAFRQLVEPCTGFDGRQSTVGEMEVLYTAGALRGDARAIAQRLSSPSIASVADPVRMAIDLLKIGDPYVITGVASYLAGRYVQGAVIDGTMLNASENAPVAMAWALVACDYGASCGATNRAVLQACSQGGLCEIQSVDELFRMTLADDEAYQRGQHYHERILLALQRRDYASLGL